ncbi:hypothetical protein D3C80_334110 [compost metagenome]
MQIVASSIGRCSLDHCLYTFHRDDFTRLPGQRQSKIAQAAEQVKHAFIGLRGQPGQCLLDHRRVDLGVDLNEISRPVRQLQAPGGQGKSEGLTRIHCIRFTLALQPQLHTSFSAERLQARLVALRQRRGVTQQQRQRRAAEQLDMAHHLRLAQALQE